MFTTNYLNLVLILGAVVETAPALALHYPNNKPQSKHTPVLRPEYGPPVPKPPPEYKMLFHKQPLPVIHQHPETSKKKPLHWNHMPSPASAPPVYTIKPPGNEPPPPACQDSTAYVDRPLWIPSGR